MQMFWGLLVSDHIMTEDWVMCSAIQYITVNRYQSGPRLTGSRISGDTDLTSQLQWGRNT